MTRRTRRLLLLALFISPTCLASEAPVEDRLADRHRHWLEEVTPIITPAERDAFDTLDRDYRRDAFVERFWKARDPHPETARNEFRDLWDERIEAARQRFGTLADSRAQILLLGGEPRSRLRGSCPDLLLPIEIWAYAPGPHLPRPVTVVFFKERQRQESFRIWSPTESARVLLREGETTLPIEPDGLFAAPVKGCRDGAEIEGHLERAVSAATFRELAVTDPGPEWVAAFLGRSTDLDSAAQTFAARLEITFPGRHRSRTVVQATIAIPFESLLEAGEDQDLRFLVDGEILRHGELFESFRYRFDLPPAPGAAAEVPLVLQRYLRPGDYTLIVRVEDLVGRSFFRETRQLEVPPVSRRPLIEPAAAPATVPGQTPAGPAPTAPPSEDHSITLLRPPAGLHTGNLRVHARTTGEGVAKVAFELDGKRLMSKRRPPWSIEIDLGRAPSRHTLRAVAIDDDGHELATDQILVNAGPQRFAVRLVEPEPGGRYAGSLRARAVVDLPRGSRLDRLEFFLNEKRLSTLFQPPFVQPLPLPDDAAMAYVRAVAYLDDGHSTESVVFINAPAHLDRLDIDLVELYTTVVDRRGRPVEGLAQSDFSVFENDVAQRILRFERAENLPFHAAVVIDTSTSMVSELDQAEKAALTFFQKIVTPRDRAAVLTFNDRPRLVVPFTNSLEMLAGGLAGLHAEGETALHDAVVSTLYHFGGLRGQRAMILLSDGQDSMSQFTFSEALDFARQTGVAIYAIGLDIPSNEHEARNKLMRLSRETGGQYFFISRGAELDRVYQTIEQELRSQYLIAYQSSLTDDDSFRDIEVRLSDPTHTAKTLKGYLP